MRAASQAVPPKIKNAAQPSLAIFAGAILGMAIVGVGAFVFFFNPSTSGFYPVCLFHQLTGLNCPGCGATRALYALLHGNLLLALKDNSLFIFTTAFLAARGAWFAAKHFSGKPAGRFLSPKMLWAFLIVSGVFTVLRNFPAFSFLSP
jgi:Protein of unknown function (DUF2752)